VKRITAASLLRERIEVKVLSAHTMSTPRLLLLPGLDGTGELFEPFARATGPASPLTIVRYSAPELSRYVECRAVVRDQLPRKEPYVLLGESFSGPIAVSLAAESPPGLVGLILVGSFVSTPRRALSWFSGFIDMLPTHNAPAWASDTVLFGRWATADLRARVKAAMSQVSPQAVRERLREIARVDVSSELSRVRAPILYLQASHDRLVPPSAAEQVQRIAPHAKVTQIEGPHLLLQCAPKQCAQAIREFVEQKEGAAAGPFE
jgi:pimeloyl-[acyl-carrier protein] methyl ester esterase